MGWRYVAAHIAKACACLGRANLSSVLAVGQVLSTGGGTETGRTELKWIEVDRSGSNRSRSRSGSKRVSSILVRSTSDPVWTQLEGSASEVDRSGSTNPN